MTTNLTKPLAALATGLIITTAGAARLAAEVEPDTGRENRPMATLMAYLLDQPAIAHPEDPFVHIFFEGGDDHSRFGFALDGEMTVDDWAKTLRHVGYLCPYTDTKPHMDAGWRVHRRDVAVRGGQQIGRPTGGCIMGLGDVRHLYAEPIALKMTHFFHDDEQWMGTPGGGGDWRMRLNHAHTGSVRTEPSALFNTRPDGQMRNFTLTFGLAQASYRYGGDHRFIASCGAGDGPEQGWAIGIANPQRHRDNIRLYFESEGQRLVSAPIPNWMRRAWINARVAVDDGDAPDRVSVTLHIEGVAPVTGTLPRPQVANGVLRIDAGQPKPQDGRHVHLDDIRLANAHGRTLAHYTFEPQPGHGRFYAQPVTRVADASGFGHDLRGDGNDQAVTFVHTHGANPDFMSRMRQHLVQDLLDVRREHGAEPPKIITNWRVSDWPKRTRVWREKVGFTVGNTEYYLYGDVRPGFANLHNVLNSRRARNADADGSRWNSAWLGNVRSNTVMTTEQWQSLVTLAVLDGNRWFMLFPAMSNGHFAPIDTGDRTLMATTNAQVLYALAQVAGWYQPTANSLAGSDYLETQYMIDDPRMAVRMRVNDATGEAWYAAMRVGTGENPAAVALPMPRRAGTVTNLATGERFGVEGGQVALPLTPQAVPMHFKPSDARVRRTDPAQMEN